MTPRQGLRREDCRTRLVRSLTSNLEADEELFDAVME
jgi:hypothetical protein